MEEILKFLWIIKMRNDHPLLQFKLRKIVMVGKWKMMGNYEIEI